MVGMERAGLEEKARTCHRIEGSRLLVRPGEAKVYLYESFAIVCVVSYICSQSPSTDGRADSHSISSIRPSAKESPKAFRI